MVLVPLDVFDKLPKTLRHDTELSLLTWASVVSTINLEGLTRQGRIKFKAITTSDRVIGVDTFPIGEFPLFLQVNASGSQRHGKVFHHLALARSGMGLMTLSSGYLTPARAGFPPAFHEHMEEGPGNDRSVAGTDPAANTEIAEAVPTNALWEVESIIFTLVTDGNAANRLVKLLITDGTNTLFTLAAGAVQTATLTRTYIWSRRYLKAEAAFDGADSIRMPLPEMRLPQAYTIETDTDNIQATDNYGAPRLKLKEWIQE